MNRRLNWRAPGSRKLTPEASVKSAIRDLCAAKRWLLVPVLARRDNRGQSLRGSPDYFVIARGRTIAVEVKRAKGGILSDDQLWFQSECHRLKAPHLVCTDALQLEAYIEQKQIPGFQNQNLRNRKREPVYPMALGGAL